MPDDFVNDLNCHPRESVLLDFCAESLMQASIFEVLQREERWSGGWWYVPG